MRRTSSWTARHLRPLRSAREDVFVAARPHGRRGDRRRLRGTRRAARPRPRVGSLAVVPPGFVDRRGDGALVSALEGRDPKPTVHPAAAVRARAPRSADARPERRDTRAHRADRTSRPRVVPCPRHARRARLGACSPSRARSVGPGVYEAAFGTPLRALVDRQAASAASRAHFCVGGFFGSWIDPFTAQRLSLLDSTTSLQAGAALGAGAIVVLPAAACGLDQSARVARYLAEESAGQCGPCVHGLAALSGAARDPRRRPRRQPAGRAALAASRFAGRGACRHPDGAAHFIESSLEVFAGEVELHLQRALQRQARRVPPDHSERTHEHASSASTRSPATAAASAPSSCPSAITLDDWGYPIVDPRPLSPELEQHAERAVAACPKLAFLLQKEAARET